MSLKSQHSDGTPEYLYKYRAFSFESSALNHLEEIFKDNIIFFASPKMLNDPFDCDPAIIPYCKESDINKFIMEQLRNDGVGNHDFRREEMRKIKKKHFNKGQLRKRTFEQLRKNIKRQWSEDLGVMCLTEKPDDILMWSHYASGHTGICLQFDRSSKKATDFFQKAVPVKYSKEHPEIRAISTKPEMRSQIMEAVLTKSCVWEYEKEWRMIDPKRDAKDRFYPEYPPTIPIGGGPGKKWFPPELLTGIIFGTFTSEDNINRVHQWIEKMKTDKKPRIYKAEKRDRNYRIVIPNLSI